MSTSYNMAPILSGLLGGLLAIIFCRSLSRWIPRYFRGADTERLVEKYRVAIRTANLCFFGGWLGGIAAYHFELLPSDDWRGLAIGSGLGSLSAAIALHASSRLYRKSSKETFVAYAVSQSLPPTVIYGIFVLLSIASTAAMASLLLQFFANSQ